MASPHHVAKLAWFALITSSVCFAFDSGSMGVGAHFTDGRVPTSCQNFYHVHIEANLTGSDITYKLKANSAERRYDNLHFPSYSESISTNRIVSFDARTVDLSHVQSTAAEESIETFQAATEFGPSVDTCSGRVEDRGAEVGLPISVVEISCKPIYPDCIHDSLIGKRVDGVRGDRETPFSQDADVNSFRFYSRTPWLSSHSLLLQLAAQSREPLSPKAFTELKAYRSATAQHTSTAYRSFLGSFPTSAKTADVRQRLSQCKSAEMTVTRRRAERVQASESDHSCYEAGIQAREHDIPEQCEHLSGKSVGFNDADNVIVKNRTSETNRGSGRECTVDASATCNWVEQVSSVTERCP